MAKEKFFALIEKMDKHHLQILLGIAKEIDGALQFQIDGNVEIDTLPNDFRCLSDLTGDPRAGVDYRKRRSERLSCRKTSIEFLKNTGLIKKYEIVDRSISITVDKKNFENIFQILKSKYDNLIQGEGASEFCLFRGALFQLNCLIYNPDSQERRALLETLWGKHRETTKDKIVIMGTRTSISDCMSVTGLDDKKTRDMINKIETTIRNKCDQISIDGKDGNGYLMIATRTDSRLKDR